MSGGLCAPLPSGKKLKKRVDDLEAAVLAVAALEFGDSAGHPFHGNQYVVMGTSDAHEEMRNGGSERLHALGSDHAVLEVESKYAANELLRKHPEAVSYTNSFDAEHHIAIGRVPRTGDEHKGVVRVSEPFFTEGTRHAVAASAEEFGDSAGHEFHGNQWTAAGGSDKYTVNIGPHPWQEGKVRVSIDEKGGERNVNSRTVDPGQEHDAIKQLAAIYNPKQEAEWAVNRAASREKAFNRTPDQIKSELDGIDEELREQENGYSARSLGTDLRERVQRALKESEDPDGDGYGTVKPPSGSEISITNSTLRELLKQRN